MIDGENARLYGRAVRPRRLDLIALLIIFDEKIFPERYSEILSVMRQFGILHEKDRY